LSQLFLQHRFMLMSYLRALVRDPNDAEDLFQEVGLRVMHSDGVPTDPSQFAAWCRGVARNLVLHHWRSKRRSRVEVSERWLDALDLAYRHVDPASDLACRRMAAGVLGQWGDAEAMEYLLKRTQKRWSTDRALAVELCGEVKAPGALEQLRAILEAPKDPCRGAAARGLGRLGAPEALPWLVALLEDTRAPEDFRMDAAEGIWLLGVPEGQARVRAAVSTFTSPEARAELAELLQETP
jgi:RNA polymerase sigma factor (sigma-70 family)